MSDKKDKNNKKFNDMFNKTLSKQKIQNKVKQQVRIDGLNNKKEDVNIFDHSVGDTLINTKDAIFDILDDMLQFKFEKSTFTKENRLYYIGIFILIIVFIIWLSTMFESNNDKIDIKKSNNNEITIIHKLIKE
jgi:hypothetical protein